MKLFAKQFGLKEEDLFQIMDESIKSDIDCYSTFRNIPDLQKEIIYNRNEFIFNDYEIGKKLFFVFIY